MQTQRKQTNLQLEALEERMLLSVNAWVENSTKRLIVDSSNNSESAKVKYTSTGRIQVTNKAGDLIKINYFGYKYSSVSRSSVANGILFRGRGGHDYFKNNTSLNVEAWGGIGRDTIIGGSGSDRIYGGDGDYSDYLWGRGGNDYMVGGNGNDFVYGGTGGDSLYGGDGEDKLYGESGADYLSGGTEDDLLVGGSENDYIIGGKGDDALYGGSGNDYMRGYEGRDYFHGGTGYDIAYGGPQWDKFHSSVEKKYQIWW